MSIDAAVAADPASFMALALEAARSAGPGGDVPVGAVAVAEGAVIATAANRRERDRDPTAHAEMLVLRETATVLDRWRLDDVTVVVTLEPCPMCAGALWAARIGGVVFGADDPRAGLHGIALQPRGRSASQPRVPADRGCDGRGVRRTAHIVLRGATRRLRRRTRLRSHRPPPLTSQTESCQSGRMGRSRKPLSSQGDQGFESLTLRHRRPRARDHQPPGPRRAHREPRPSPARARLHPRRFT